MQRGYPAAYYALVRYCPWGWRAGFALLDHPLVYAVVQPLRRRWNLCVTRRFTARLRCRPPDLIITTHFFPTDVAAACKRAGWLEAPLLVVVTDLLPHRLWIAREAEAYVFGTEEGAAAARRRGMDARRVHVLGIPIAGRFHAAFDRHDLNARFELQPGRRTVLMTSGGNTVGPFEAVVEALIGLEESLPGQVQLVVVCGDNAAAARRLTARARTSRMPVQVHGFVETMPELMAASDLIVTKAGGVTVSEALGRGIPLVVYHVIPGQEQENARYVARHGAAVIATRPAEAAAAVRRLLNEPERLAAMREAARTLSRPDAAAAIVEEVVKPLLQSVVQRRPSSAVRSP